MVSSRVSLTSLLLGFVLLAASAQADRITLTNGRVIEGRVISQDERRVTIEVRGMITQIATSSIQSIEVASDWENTFRDIETALRRRDAIRGLDLVFRAAQEGAPLERLADLLERNNGGIAGSIFQSTTTERTTLRIQLRQLAAEDGLLTPRGRFLLAQNFHVLEDWSSAAEMLASIPAEFFEQDPDTRAWSLGFLRQLIRRLVNRGEMQTAIIYIEEMWRLSGGESSPEITLATLHRASRARELGDFREAFRIIVEDLQPLSPELARNRLAATRDAMLAEATMTGRFADALSSAAPLEGGFPIEFQSIRIALANKEASHAYSNGEYRRVLELTAKIPEREITESVRHLILLSQHALTLQDIGENDPIALFQHGQWCVSNGLLDQAIEVFSLTRTNPNLRELSDEAIRLARRERDTILLEQANAAFRDGLISNAMPKVDLIISRQDLGSALMTEATKLRDLMMRSIAREREEAPYRAEILFQEAERTYFMKDYAGAFNQLNAVIENFPTTPAGKRAAALLADVVRDLEIAHLEGRSTIIPRVPERFNSDILQRSDLLTREVTALLDALLAEGRREAN